MPTNQEIISVAWKPQTGGLNTSVSLRDIKGGDMPDGLNVRAIGDGENVSLDYEIIKGNRYVATVEDVTAQNKIIRFNVDCGIDVVSYQCDISILDQNGIILTGTQTVTIIGNNFYVTPSPSTVENIINALDAILGSGNYTYSINALSDSTGYIDIEIINDFIGVPWPYADWNVSLTAFTNDVIRITAETITEAIDIGLEGIQQCIGSTLIEGVSWEFWTSQKKDKQLFLIKGVADNGSGVIQITVDDTTDIIDNSTVVIYGVDGVPANGTWVTGNTTGTTFDLLGSTFSGAYVTGGTIINNPYGIGEIGVVTHNENDNTYQYTRLLRSKAWNFRTINQIDCTGERNISKYSIYWNDYSNNDRVFYYKTPFVVDGGLSINGGTYFYNTIDTETTLIQNSFNARVSLLQVNDGGGAVLSGNHLYFVRGKTDALTTTICSEPSGLINIYLASFGNAEAVIGDDAAVTTNKTVSLYVTNIPAGAYKYLELIDVNFSGSSIITRVVTSYLLANDQTTATITHTGYETDSFIIPTTEVITVFTPFTISRNICILQNHLIRSKLKGLSQLDFTDFFNTGRHSLFKKTIPTTGCVNASPTDHTNHISFNEYFDPENVNSNIGYMPNECYRFMGKVLIKAKYGGGFSQTFWIDDILMDTNAYNIDVAYPDNRRDLGFTDWSLTDSFTVDPGGDTAPNPYVFYVSLHDFDLTTLIDFNGVMLPVRELIETIYIERADVVPEVLAGGIAVMSMHGYFENTAGANRKMHYGKIGDLAYGEYPMISGSTFAAYRGWNNEFTPDNLEYSAALLRVNIAADEDYGAFYAPDILQGQLEIVNQPTDTFLNFGATEINETFGFCVTNSTGTREYESNYVEYGGYVNQVAPLYTSHVVDDMQTVYSGTEEKLINGIKFSKLLKLNPLGQRWTIQTSPCFHVTTALDASSTPAPAIDRGVRTVRYYRAISQYTANYDPDTSKYGKRGNTLSVPTGALYDVTAISPDIIPVNDIDVYGGDTLIQKTYLKYRTVQIDELGTTSNLGFGGGISFYSPNRINSQMRRKELPTDQELFPALEMSDWLETKLAPEPLFYNAGYTPQNQVTVHRAFDSNIEQITNYPTRIEYSNNKPNDSLVDNYRYILPLSFYDDDLSYGETYDMFVLNGNLITRQRQKVNRHFFDPTALISQSDGSQVITGSGGYLRRRPLTVTLIGSENKWSRSIGMSNGGNQVAYWYNPSTYQIVRYGADGTVPISDIHLMSPWFRNRGRWVIGKDTPCYSEGICSVWDNQFKEMIMTFRGHKQTDLWNIDNDYSSGDEVYVVDNSLFVQPIDIYIAIQDAIAGTLITNTAYWLKIDHSNTNYYTEFTMVFNEVKNKYQPRQSCLPRIYMSLPNGYMSPNPNHDTNNIFVHNQGNYAQWYDGQSEDGFLIPVTNAPENRIKTFVSQRFEFSNPPYKVEWTTNSGQVSSAIASDFETLEGNSDIKILQDSTVTLDPKADGGMLYGDYLATKIYFQSGTYQRLSSMITRLWNRSINWTK